MCIYYLISNRCGHLQLIAGPNCQLLYHQLQRINSPYERERYEIPFEVPEQCRPNECNIQNVGMIDKFCGQECMNNALQRGCGEPNARYGPGSERIGVGFRTR
ncbi:hypothetical protein BJ878DRAFT_279668 [Calycina marina]|uniref:Uncharacterized protein n=1 Tax=Calycina marina TaxID=1763456 RepID=A0A9P7Z6W3_9HELO|nr:hypothetical protein BJ878DRAFT_279668 [Calycina marina]